MKIQVVIEATSIEEYTEAVKALAAGYTVAPVVNNVVVENVKVDSSKPVVDQLKVAEEKPKRTRKAVSKNADTGKVEQEPIEVVKEETPITESKKDEGEPTQSESTGNEISFVDVKLKAKQLANLPDGKADVKFILEKLGATKLSDLGQNKGDYEKFMELAEEVERTPKQSETDTAPAKEVETEQDSTEDIGKKVVTIEMIRGKAKQLSVAGYKEEIKAVLKTFGAVSLTKLDKKDYDSFYGALVSING